MAKIDGIDAVYIVGGLCVTATAPTLLVALPIALLGWGLHAARYSKGVAEWADRVSGRYPAMDRVMPLLAPGPEDYVTPAEMKPLQLNAPTNTERSPWSQRITQPMEALSQPKATEKLSTADAMAQVLAIMPKRIGYDHPKLTEPPTPLSVLLGYDPLGKRWVWADFGKDTIHAFIAGQTRAGKDSQIRFWFTQLTSSNAPEDVQFIIIDAKGEWVTSALKNSKHMAVPPVGGFNLKIERGNTGKRQLRDLANEAIEDALIDTIEILQARADLFQKVGATNLQAYERRTGKKLPLLFVVVTDVGTNLNGILEELVRFLVLKGGSLGVRAIISMQTASGEDTSWRGQMGLAMSGYQGQASADAPNLGIPVRAMKYRPSELPGVDIPENRGLFVVRKGDQQVVVRAAYLPDEVFENYCEQVLPSKNARNNNELLESLILDTDKAPKPVKQTQALVPARILTVEQARLVALRAKEGYSTSVILTDHLKFTSGPKYAQAKPHVDAIVNVVRRKLQAQQ